MAHFDDSDYSDDSDHGLNPRVSVFENNVEEPASASRAFFRDELQHFASTLLRREIAEGCDNLLQKLVQELQENGVEMKGVVRRPSLMSGQSLILSGDTYGYARSGTQDLSGYERSGSQDLSGLGRTRSSIYDKDGDLPRTDTENGEAGAVSFTLGVTPSGREFGSTFSMGAPDSKAIERFTKRELQYTQEFTDTERVSILEYFKVCGDMHTIINVIIGLSILLNGIFIGVQTDYQSRLVTEDVPVTFNIMEIIFFAIFTADLIRNWCEYGWRFYYMPGCSWNYFDTFLVFLQLFDVLGILLDDSNPGFSFLRVLRVLRLFRFLRVMRLLRSVDQLETIVNSIVNSAQSLGWTVLLLLIMMYMFGIVFCQIVFMHRIDHLEEDFDEIDMWWGSLARAILSLYQAILGGVDWDSMLRPMMDDISPFVAVLFCAYMAFAVLAVMNVITGTFVQSSITHSTMEKAHDFADAARAALSADLPAAKRERRLSEESTESSGQQTMVSKQSFLRVLSDTNFARWLGNMNIEAEQAMLLFNILQRNEGVEGRVDSDSLVDGLGRMGESAKFMDVMKLMHEHHRNQKRFRSIDQRLEVIRRSVATKLDSAGKEIAATVLATVKEHLQGEFESLMRAVTFNHLSV